MPSKHILLHLPWMPSAASTKSSATERSRCQAVSSPSGSSCSTTVSHAGQAGYEVLTPFVLNNGRAVSRESRLGSFQWLSRPAARHFLAGISSRNRDSDEWMNCRMADSPVVAHHRPADANWPKVTSFPTHEELETALGKKTRASHRVARSSSCQAAMCASGRHRAWHRRDISHTPSSGGVLPSCCSCSTSASIFARCPDGRIAPPRPAIVVDSRGDIPVAGVRCLRAVLRQSVAAGRIGEQG